jgi:hypothetical protein
VATLVALAAVAALDAILPRGADALLHIFFADGAWFFVGKWEAKKKRKRERETKKNRSGERATKKAAPLAPPQKKRRPKKWAES